MNRWSTLSKVDVTNDGRDSLVTRNLRQREWKLPLRRKSFCTFLLHNESMNCTKLILLIHPYTSQSFYYEFRNSKWLTKQKCSFLFVFIN